jgi:hypothetical protein
VLWLYQFAFEQNFRLFEGLVAAGLRKSWINSVLTYFDHSSPILFLFILIFKFSNFQFVSKLFLFFKLSVIMKKFLPLDQSDEHIQNPYSIQTWLKNGKKADETNIDTDVLARLTVPKV